jgi:hypothetical protein
MRAPTVLATRIAVAARIACASRFAFATLSLILATEAAMSQSPNPPLGAAEAAAQPADVASPEAIVQTVYSVISGALGAPRDWPRLVSLMAPGAIFAVTGVGKDGTIRTRVFSVGDYVLASSRAAGTSAFYERGVIGPTWRYANTATVTSPYESRHAPDEAPFQRGVNTFQLAFDGTRWWIVSIAWEAETSAFPLPSELDRLLHAK